MAWLRIFRNKKQVEAKCTNLVECRGLLRSWSKKAAVQDEGFGLWHSRLLWSPTVSAVQPNSSHDFCQIIKLTFWLLFFVFAYQGVLQNAPVHYSLIHAMSISWEAAMTWSWGFGSMLYHHLPMQSYAGHSTSQGLDFTFFCVDFRMWSQQWQEICLHVHFHILSAKQSAWHLRGAQNPN